VWLGTNCIASNKLAYNIKNEIISLDSISKPYFIVFYQQPSCGACLTSLGKALDSIAARKTKIIIVVNTGSSAIARKSEIIYLKDKITFDSTFFVNTQDKKIINSNTLLKTIFDDYNITSTPCLLYVTKDNEYFFDHNYLFPINYNAESIYELLNKITAKPQ
jgi:hypothetical protein